MLKEAEVMQTLQESVEAEVQHLSSKKLSKSKTVKAVGTGHSAGTDKR